MSGGLHGFLNSTSKTDNNFNQSTNDTNKKTASNITNLAKAAYNARNK